MTAIQLINSLPVIQKLMDLKLPVKKAYSIYTLAKQINDNREFFIKEEKKIIDKFNVTILESGSLEFKSPEDQLQFIEEHNELSNYEVENFNIIELSFDDLKEAELSALEIAALDGIIKFIDWQGVI